MNDSLINENAQVRALQNYAVPRPYVRILVLTTFDRLGSSGDLHGARGLT